MNKNAYTLIELMVTVTVISILLLMAYSKFDEVTTRQSVKNASQQIAFAVSQARNYTRSKGVVTNLKFPSSSNTFQIKADGVELTNSNYNNALSGVLPDEVKILNSTCPDMNIYIDGSLVDSSGNLLSNSCQITVGKDYSIKRTITIHASSGNVSYE